jgi:O-antigen/teichoic acid export membrane protein
VSGRAKIEQSEALGLADRVKGAVLWRSGGQIVAQLITWTSTFVVIRLLDPKDYGLFAMTQVVLMFLSLMSGYGFTAALIRDESIDRRKIAQVFGMLILLNGGLAITQLLMAPVAAAYFRQPIIADMLRVQALLFVFTPFIAIPNALLSREIDFRRQAKVDLFASVCSAATALLCALSGFGVWTLVAAPLVLFGTRALVLTIVGRGLVWPSFRFAGAGTMFRYGGTMVAVQFFWLLQSQSDVFIAGRILSPHEIGLYTTALFLTTILSAKFVPPLNDVAFAAYSKIQNDPEAMASAFLKTVRLIMLIALPFYVGLAATAEPAVLTVLGPKWAQTIPLVQLLALAMPFMTLQILFAPATNALGRPEIALRVAVCGAALLPISFLVGIQFGTRGMATAWLVAFPILTAITASLALPVIGVRVSALARAIAPGLLASAGMMLPVLMLDSALPPLPPAARLAILVPVGAAAYAVLLLLFARAVVADLLRLVRKPAALPAEAA